MLRCAGPSLLAATLVCILRGVDGQGPACEGAPVFLSTQTRCSGAFEFAGLPMLKVCPDRLCGLLNNGEAAQLSPDDQLSRDGQGACTTIAATGAPSSICKEVVSPPAPSALCSEQERELLQGTTCPPGKLLIGRDDFDMCRAEVCNMLSPNGTAVIGGGNVVYGNDYGCISVEEPAENNAETTVCTPDPGCNLGTTVKLDATCPQGFGLVSPNLFAVCPDSLCAMLNGADVAQLAEGKQLHSGGAGKGCTIEEATGAASSLCIEEFPPKPENKCGEKGYTIEPGTQCPPGRSYIGLDALKLCQHDVCGMLGPNASALVKLGVTMYGSDYGCAFHEADDTTTNASICARDDTPPPPNTTWCQTIGAFQSCPGGLIEIGTDEIVACEADLCKYLQDNKLTAARGSDQSMLQVSGSSCSIVPVKDDVKDYFCAPHQTHAPSPAPVTPIPPTPEPAHTPQPALPNPDDESGGGLSGGAIFLIIFFVGGFVYCAGGALYNYYGRGERGASVIPNRGFWSALPGLVHDGVRKLCGKPPAQQSTLLN